MTAHRVPTVPTSLTKVGTENHSRINAVPTVPTVPTCFERKIPHARTHVCAHIQIGRDGRDGRDKHCTVTVPLSLPAADGRDRGEDTGQARGGSGA